MYLETFLSIRFIIHFIGRLQYDDIIEKFYISIENVYMLLFIAQKK